MTEPRQRPGDEECPPDDVLDGDRAAAGVVHEALARAFEIERRPGQVPEDIGVEDAQQLHLRTAEGAAGRAGLVVPRLGDEAIAMVVMHVTHRVAIAHQEVHVEELAGEHRISLRTGCFCNPGAGEAAEGITADDVNAALEIREDLTLARFLEIVTARGGKSAGAIRVSFGLASNFADAERFLTFARSFRDQSRLAIGEATFDIESCRVIRDGS